MKLSNCFCLKPAANVDESYRPEKAEINTSPPSAPGDASVMRHNGKRAPTFMELSLRKLVGSASTSQGNTPLFDTTREPADVRATIEWLEQNYHSLGDEKNGLPSKPITAQPPAGKKANGGFNASELGARLGADQVIALHVTPDGILPGRNDGLFGRYLDKRQLCPLAPEQIGTIGKITSPHVSTSESAQPNLEPHVRNIDARTATHLICARATLDLVKALLPFGAGNQIKDLARTGGESHMRSVLAKRSAEVKVRRAPSEQKCVHRAKAALLWKSGFCDENAALAFAILRSLPELKDARVDWIVNRELRHNMAIIRGDTPEHDVIVDPWMIFPVPCLLSDATDFHQEMAQPPEMNPRNEVVSSKPAGELFPPLDVTAILRAHEKLPAGLKDPHGQYRQQIYFSTPAKRIHDNITDPTDPDSWDIPYNGNPNTRYRLEGNDGEPPVTLRFDMQRVAKNR